tara:strand:- start:418 stop:624 length:207 start_codon:yes stop_codon:yes gene_type:complete
MKHSITNDLITLKKVISILEEEKEVIIEIETFDNSDGSYLNSENFSFSKEQLHSFIGTLLHVQSKLRK